MSAPIREIPASRLCCAPLIRYWDEKKVEAMIAQAKIVARLRNGRFLTFCPTRRRNRNSDAPLTSPPPDRTWRTRHHPSGRRSRRAPRRCRCIVRRFSGALSVLIPGERSRRRSSTLIHMLKAKINPVSTAESEGHRTVPARPCRNGRGGGGRMVTVILPSLVRSPLIKPSVEEPSVTGPATGGGAHSFCHINPLDGNYEGKRLSRSPSLHRTEVIGIVIDPARTMVPAPDHLFDGKASRYPGSLTPSCPGCASRGTVVFQSSQVHSTEVERDVRTNERSY